MRLCAAWCINDVSWRETNIWSSGPSVRHKVVPYESPTGRCRTVPCVSQTTVHLPGLSSSGDRKMCLARPAMSSCNIPPCSDVRKGHRRDAEMTEVAVHTRDLPQAHTAAATTGTSVISSCRAKVCPEPFDFAQDKLRRTGRDTPPLTLPKEISRQARNDEYGLATTVQARNDEDIPIAVCVILSTHQSPRVVPALLELLEREFHHRPPAPGGVTCAGSSITVATSIDHIPIQG